MPTPDVTVVMATYNRAPLLARALACLDRQTGCRVEVVVVDDGSTDDTTEVLRLAAARSPRLRFVSRRTNDGPATARNVGWRLAASEWIAFTDDDCEPAPDWAASLLEAAARSGADLVQGRTIPNPAQRFAGYWDRSVRVERFSDRYQTCNLLVRRTVLEALDGFDESFPFAGEDTDLGWRARKSGCSATYAPEALVHHAIRPCSFVQHLRDRRTWAQLTQVIHRHPETRSLLFCRVFYRRSHAVLLVAGPASLALATRVGWWLPPVLVVGLTAYRAHRIDRRAWSLRSRVLYGAQSVVSTVWETVQFVRSSVRERTIVL